MNESEILTEILVWERLRGIQVLRQLLPKLLDTEEKKKLYELTDGKNGIREIKIEINMATGKISKLWNMWTANGVLNKNGKKFEK